MNILMPAMSPTMESGTLAKWLVTVGARIKAGDIIAEIETDKATMEVEATDDGVIAEILVPAGTEDVPVQTPIARLGTGAMDLAADTTPSVDHAPPDREPVGAAQIAPSAELVLAPSARRLVEEHGLDPASLTATGKNGRVTKGDALAAVAQTATRLREISPLALKIAGQMGLDLSRVEGSGVGGRILKADIIAPRPRTPARATELAPPPPAADPDHAVTSRPGARQDDLAATLVPLDGMRKTIARRMTDSFRDVPHFPLTIDVELDDLLAARAEINRALEGRGVKVSVNDMVIKAAAVALCRVPEVNASYSAEGILRHRTVDIAMAVAIPDGLITPIVRTCEAKGLAQIATETRDLAERARARKLKPEEFQGGTFSVSNLGMFAIKSFSSIINAPQGAILSVGAAQQRPIVRDGQIAVATTMSITLTCDHRVMDGMSGSRWLEAFKALVEFPLGLAV
jgi:pyruvate dehydrogenase E2 component (dihydrolipoamide acetyltransferase)